MNSGVENFNGKNYDQAIKDYRMAQQIRPQTRRRICTLLTPLKLRRTTRWQKKLTAS